MESDEEEVRLDPEIIKTAVRLPVKDGKIILDRNNPDHVKWMEED